MIVLAAALLWWGCAGTRGLEQARPAPYSVRDIMRLPFPIQSPIYNVVREHGRDVLILPRQEPAAAGHIVLYRYRPGTGRADSLLLPIPGDSVLHPRGGATDFFADGNRIAVLCFRALLVYEQNSGGGYALCSCISLPVPYENVFIRGGDVWMATSEPHQRAYSERCTRLTCVHVGDENTIDSMFLSDSEGFHFTAFQPRHVVDFGVRGLILSDITRYRVRIVDFAGRAVDSLTRTDGQWALPLDTSYRKFIRPVGPIMFRAKANLDSLRPYLARMPMVRHALWLGADSILVAWQAVGPHESGVLAGQPRLLFDLWRHERGRWVLVARDAEDFNPAAEDRWEQHNGNWPVDLAFVSGASGTLYKLAVMPPGDFTGLSYAEVRKRREDYVRREEPALSLLRYTVELGR